MPVPQPPDRRALRIVSLNVWGGRILDPLLAFVRQQAPDTDIFCFQEVLAASELAPTSCGFRTTLFAELSHELPDFTGVLDPMATWEETAPDGRRVPVPYGPATFVRRTLPVEERRAVVIAVHQDNLDAAPGLHPIARPLQLTRLGPARGNLLVATYHGIARPGTKLDTDERLAQSRTLRRVLAEHPGPVVLIGDFNLLPHTESIRLLEQDFRNLVMERGIPTTRSRLNPYHGTPEEQPHADYAFVSPGLTVLDFQVPDLAVSDHLPLIVSFEVRADARLSVEG